MKKILFALFIFPCFLYTVTVLAQDNSQKTKNTSSKQAPAQNDDELKPHSANKNAVTNPGNSTNTPSTVAKPGTVKSHMVGTDEKEKKKPKTK